MARVEEERVLPAQNFSKELGIGRGLLLKALGGALNKERSMVTSKTQGRNP
jgi:hypothetical protein